MTVKKNDCKCGKLKDVRALQCRSCKDAEPKVKKCNGCHLIFSIDEYNLRTNGRGGYKRRSRCKLCERKAGREYREKNLDACRARKKRYDQSHPEKVNEWSFKARMKRMGLDHEFVLKYIEQHNGVCEICGDKPSFRKLAVDHCHITSAMRGLLCSTCNTGIGMFKDDTSLLLKAILYLQKHNTPGRNKDEAEEAGEDDMAF